MTDPDPLAGELVVAEVFGPTWQGEGPSLGRRAGFVRLGRCDLACSFCDTPYTWDWSRFDPAVELHRRTVSDVAGAIEEMDVGLVVVTGGEPLLQQRTLIALLDVLHARSFEIEIETAGHHAPAPEVVALVHRFNVSPKLESSGNPRDRRYKPDVLRGLVATGKAAFKFVATAERDLDEINEIVEACALPPAAVWVMPEGTDATTVVERGRALAEPVLARGWNLTTRLHVLLWGDERGR
ncbi:MAG TPA: 7-carboxy-7-deazaguanine synthase QueE [Acidimicrobiales bacterium]|nr:7-carboxy-7-deazaguanine synthase QueE [Acidimicrobiales bacterium]